MADLAITDHDNDASRFAERLKELRTANGLTQQQLADRAGLKLGGIRDLEQGVNNPTWPTVLALATALGVDCRAFTTPAEPTTPPRRGRPRKAAAVAPDTARAAAVDSEPQKTPDVARGKRKGRKRK